MGCVLSLMGMLVGPKVEDEVKSKQVPGHTSTQPKTIMVILSSHQLIC